MLALKPAIFAKNGQKFVMLTLEEFRALQEELEDAADLRILNQAVRREKHKPGVSIKEARRKLGIKK